MGNRLPALSLSVLLTFVASTAAHAQRLPEKAVALDIPAMPLRDALHTFASQSGLQVVFPPQMTQDFRTAALSGKYTPQQALALLLANTSLRYEVLSSRTVSVVEAASTPADTHPSTYSPSASSEGDAYSADALRLAQASANDAQSDSSVDKRNEEQTQQREPAHLEEVVVTAQKREERLLDVPISVVAISSKELESQNVRSIDDLAFSVPGMAVNSSGTLSRQIEIRGISNILTGNSPLIGMYLDEADVTLETSFQLDLSAFDLQRVEVLRGPQGTLYGEGSAGGTIRFITNSPALDSFGTEANITETFSQYGAPGLRSNVMLNVPEIPGQLGLRITGVVDQGGGWIDVRAANLKNYNGENLVNVRLNELWKPFDQFTVNAWTIIYRNRTPPNVGENPVGTLVPVFGGTIAPTATADYNVSNVTVNYEFQSFHILNSSSYITQEKRLDNLPNSYQVTPPGTPLFYEDFFHHIRDRNFNDELRAASLGTSPWQWTVGAIYKDERNYFDNHYSFSYAGSTPSPVADVGEQDTSWKSWSAFGDTSYKLWDRLTVGAGVRAYREDQTLISGPPPLITQSGKFHSVDPRFYAQFKLSEGVSLYSSAAKGFRSGGFNVLGEPSFGPEDVWTYELGVKTSDLQGHFYADADVFYSKYSNYQILAFLPQQTAIYFNKNAGAATIKGVEADLKWRLNGQWNMGLSGSYLHAVFTSIEPDATADFSVGDRVDGVPKYTFVVSAERDFAVSEKSGFLRLDYQQQGPQEYSVRSLGPWYVNQSDTIHMLNFNSSLNWNEHLRLGFFVENLLNDRGYVTPYGNENDGTRPRPRTFGVEVGFKY